MDNPSKLPDVGSVEEFREPIAECHILVPPEFVGDVIVAAAYASGTPNPVAALTVGDRLRISTRLVGWPNTTDVMGGAQIQSAFTGAA